jgi:hypothetical protein
MKCKEGLRTLFAFHLQTNPQKTIGEITYSSPNLASGDVLFKDVLVEYK